jgi:hypothetical protein
MTEIRVNVTPGNRHAERVGRLVVTEVEFDLLPAESAENSIEFKTVEVQPSLMASPSVVRKGWFRRLLSSIWSSGGRVPPT